MFSFLSVAQNQTLIAKIELPNRVLNIKTFKASSVITENITCEKRIALSIGQNNIKQELWVLKLPSNHTAEKIKYLKTKKFIKNLEPMLYAIGQASISSPTITSTPFYLKDPSLDLLKKLGSKEIIVALLDTGIDRNHPNLESSIHINTAEIINGIDDDNNGYIDDRYGYDFTNESAIKGDPEDKNGHGTHLAGIIAAKKNEVTNFEGIGQNVKLLNVKCLNQFNEGSQINLALAIRYAVDNGADIINCSWAVRDASWVLEDAINYAIQHNVIIVAAAGNYSQSQNVYPASYPKVFSISTIKKNNTLSNIANKNLSFDYAIYGEKIESTSLNNQFMSKSGTSQSAAFFSGIIANILSITRDISHENLSELLLSSSRLNKSNNIEYKILDLDSLAQNTSSYYPQYIYRTFSDSINSHVNTWPNPAINQDISFKISSPSTPNGSSIQIMLFDENGKKIKTLHTTYTPDTIITWDGKNNQNQYIKNGSYFYTIKRMSPEKLLYKGTISILNS